MDKNRIRGIPLILISLVFVFGITQAQTSGWTASEWTSGTAVYSTDGDSIVAGVTIYSNAIDLRKALTVWEDPNTVRESGYATARWTRAITAYKLPSKLSFQWKSIETLTNSDSINARKGVQFSADSTTWSNTTWLDTLLSTTADTGATVSEFHVLSLADFPDLTYMRIVNTDASASGDTSTIVDKYGLRFTE